MSIDWARVKLVNVKVLLPPRYKTLIKVEMDGDLSQERLDAYKKHLAEKKYIVVGCECIYR